MGKTIIIKPDQLGQYLRKKQAETSNTDFCTSLGISRPTLSAIRSGANYPRQAVLEKLGLEMVYRTIPVPAAPPAIPAKKKSTPKKK